MHGLDYHEIFSLVMKIASVRILLPLATTKNYEVHQIDFKTTFLNKSFKKKLHEATKRIGLDLDSQHKICKMKKTLWI
jgi:hypothetical protein